MSSSANSNGGNSISTHTFQPNIKVNFANQQISLSSKFIESVTSKIKQLKEEASKEPDEQKKMAIINKHQNIETMLKNSLMEYKQKLQQQKQQQQAQNQQQQSQNQQKVEQQQQQTQQNPQQTQQTQQNAQQTNTNADAANNSYVSIKNYLTEEQKLQYANINKQFQQKIQQIVSTYDNNKKELEKILEKIKATNPDTMQTEMGELMAMKTKCENNGKTLQAAYKNLETQMGDLKKRFYLKCSETNVELKKALMMAQMSQRQRQGNPQQQQPQQQEQTNTQPANKISVQSAPSSTPAPKKPTPSQTATPVTTQPKATGENILKPSINENSFLPDVSSTIKPVPIKETSYKKDPTQPTISGGYLGSNPILSQPLNRILPQPVSTSAGAQGAASVTAAGGGKKNAYIPTPQDHILTKRKLRDLLKQYNGNSANIDGDVEELLLDLSDNFIEQVVKFGGKVAKLRKSENLEVKDVKFALEKGFGLEL